MKTTPLAIIRCGEQDPGGLPCLEGERKRRKSEGERVGTNRPQPITVSLSCPHSPVLNPADTIPAAAAHASSHTEPTEGRVCSRCSCPDALEVALSSATFGSFGVQSPAARHTLVCVLITYQIMDAKYSTEYSLSNISKDNVGVLHLSSVF